MSLERGSNHREIDLQKLWTDFESGAPFRAIAKKYRMNHATLASRLYRANKNRHKEIMKHRKKRSTWFKIRTDRWKTKIKANMIPNIWKDLEASNVTLRQIATKYKIKYTTLTRWLQAADRERYLRIVEKRMRKARRNIPPVPSAIWMKLERGKLLNDVSKEYGIDRRTLGYRLQRIDRNRYERIVKQRPHKLHFGSLEAKRQGADSLFELGVKNMLTSCRVNFEFHAKLKLDRHLYEPDFIFSAASVIFEVAGITFRSYWKQLRKKIRSYVKHGYTVLVIVPGTSLYKKAERYLPEHNRIRIVKYIEFKDKISVYTRTLEQTFETGDKPTPEERA